MGVPRDAVEFQRLNVVRNDVSKYNQRIETMIKLVKRMEQEGEVYVELRSRMRSQAGKARATVRLIENAEGGKSNISTSIKNEKHRDKGFSSKIIPDIDKNTDADTDTVSGSDSDSDSDEEEDHTIAADEDAAEAWRIQNLRSGYGAPPGPSTVLYDLVLDAIAVTEEASRRTVYDPLLGLERAQTLRDSVLERYNLDVGRRHSRAGRNQKAQQPLGGGEKSRLTERMASTSMFSVKDDAINQTNYSLDVTAASVLSMPTP